MHTPHCHEKLARVTDSYRPLAHFSHTPNRVWPVRLAFLLHYVTTCKALEAHTWTRNIITNHLATLQLPQNSVALHACELLQPGRGELTKKNTKFWHYTKALIQN